MPTKEATFISPDASLRLVRIPQHRRMNDRGEWYTTGGHTVEFHEGVYATDDSEVIEFLRDHAQNGPLFVEQGNEPDRPSPDASDLLGQIVEAAVEKDADRLAEIYVQERHTHSRNEVLTAAAKAIEALDEDVPAAPEPPVHEQVRVRPEGVVGARPGAGAPGEVEFASQAAEKAAKGRDLVPGGGSGKDGAYTVADLQ